MAEVPALEIRGLTRRYGKVIAVEDLDLTVQVGDIYGFLGPNGAGKTTALRAALGLIRRDTGTVRLFGDDRLVGARSKVGAIIETPAFHSWMSGRENLLQAGQLSGLGGVALDREVDRVLERVELTERAQHKAGGYSLGMRQRLGIARALMGGPKLLVLDEPTNGLDPRGMREVRELVRSLALHDGITVLISSHLLAEVQAMCNRVGILQRGRLRAEGTVAELLSEGAGDGIVEVGALDMGALSAAVAGIEGVENLGAGAEGRLRLRCGELPLYALNAQLVGQGVQVSALVPARRNLEDVFMEVTR
ncbi:MAG: ABC transporter ATP-binding protein [Deltaproteobacteria bacterium]|nr:ABC transporter ATP-binding protein [Deltaproteobacteria bacterium]